jgi:hypothetical protein
VDVKIVLSSAGPNQRELEEVIKHYDKESDSLKRNAAYFLIEQMRFHHSYKGSVLDSYDVIFDKIRKYEKITPLKGNIHFPIVNSWSDSIIKAHGFPHIKVLSKQFDHQVISAEILIENIDCAFEAWNYPWCKHLTFKEFCEYILPYRFQDEHLERWRPIYMKTFKWLIDSMGVSNDPVRACASINRDIRKWFRFNEDLSVYPTAISPLNLLKAKMGRCLDQAGIANFAMRAMGIPVVHEIIPQWGDRSMGHDFSAVLDKNRKFHAFLGGELDPGQNEIRNRAPKIFMQLFSVQRKALLDYDIGTSFVLGLPFGRDVTSRFLNTKSIFIPKSSTVSSDKLFLAVFDNNRWVPVFEAEYLKDGYLFKDMGQEIMYLPCILSGNSLVPVHCPLYIDSLGKKHIISLSNEMHTVELNRKFPLTAVKRWWMTLMGGGRFEGANKSDFSDRELLHIIPDTIQLKSHIVKLLDEGNFRYVRYIFPHNKFGSLGELGFYNDLQSASLTGQLIKSPGVSDEDSRLAFDGKLNEFLHTPAKDTYNYEWIGLDLNEKKKISYVSYSPRSDQNGIVKGMTYELFYWDEGWRSLGKKIAPNDYIVYSKVPMNALLYLKNLTEGKEERIFLYENDQQKWF